jgi:hypothetical protein
MTTARAKEMEILPVMAFYHPQAWIIMGDPV